MRNAFSTSRRAGDRKLDTNPMKDRMCPASSKISNFIERLQPRRARGDAANSGSFRGTHNAEAAMPASGLAEGRDRRAMSIRFDLTDLRLFLHVAEASNITHGA